VVMQPWNQRQNNFGFLGLRTLTLELRFDEIEGDSRGAMLIFGKRKVRGFDGVTLGVVGGGAASG